MVKDLQFFETKIINTNKPDNLVIFLHGYGSNGKDLLSLSVEFAKVLPNAHFISPNAPFDFEMPIDNGYQWFSLINSDLHIVGRKVIADPEVAEANNILDKFIKSQLKRFSLQYKDLILVGFSQGAMMAMYYSLKVEEEIAGIIAYSGKLILPTNLSEPIKSKPKICLIHGKLDMIVPFEHMVLAEKSLRELKIPFESHGIDELEHTIDLEGVEIAKRFLNKIKFFVS